MKMRLLLVAASVAVLCSCGSRDRDSDRGKDRNESSRNEDRNTSSSSSSSNSSGASTGSAAADPQLEREIAQAVEVIRPQLPLRQQTPNGVITINNIEARGAELIYHMEFPADLNEAGFQRMEEALPQQACANPQARALFDRGGSYTYRITDSGGEEFTTSIRGC